MKIRHVSLALVLMAAFSAISVFAAGSKEELARRAVSPEGANAVRELRAMGREGLDTLFTVYAADIKRFSETGSAGADWERIADAIDAVAMQKDAYASRLYWYTDLEQAQEDADSQNKPILSLRLLGNLNEEFSCANSRFFRALLYANSDISKYLRENYILHWRSVRPAPRVTIDFGDGRKIERTLTGNSIHYILSEKGDVIDALPGLYSPAAFMIYISQARDVNKVVRGLAVQPRETALQRYRKISFDRIKARRDAVVANAKVVLAQPKETSASELTAMSIAPLAMTKSVAEVPILQLYDDFARFAPQIDLADWHKLARAYSPSPKFDAGSLAFIRRQNRELTGAEFAKLLTNLQTFVALDTTRNDFLFHQKLYEWLNRGPWDNIDNFNARVYSELFKTPDSDKWLGLYSSDVYTALDGNGVIK